MKKFLALLLTLVLLGGMSGVALGEEAPKVYYWDGSLTSREASNPDDLEVLRNFIIEMTGINPQPYYPTAGAESAQLSILLSDESQPLDSFLAGDWHVYAAEGLIMPINDLLQEYGQDLLNDPGITQAMWDAMTDSEGNIWGIPTFPPHVLPRPVQIRQDWLDMYGLKMPTNMEEFEEVLKTFAEKDPAGDGKTIPLLVAGWGDGFVCSFVGAYIDTGFQWWTGEDGKLYPWYLNPGFKDALAKFAEWYEKGYIYKESFQTDTNHRKELIQQDRVGVYLGWYSTVCNAGIGLEENNPDALYQVPVELGWQTYGKVSTNCQVFLKRSQNPEAMMQYINWQAKMYTEHVAYKSVFSYGTPELFDYKIWTVDEDGWSINGTDPNSVKLAAGELAYFYCPDRTKTTMSLAEYLERNLIANASHYYWVYLPELGYEPVPYPQMGKKGDDYNFLPDSAAIDEAVPFMADIDRTIDAEGIKFVTGQRSLDTLDEFVNSLYSMGLQDYIDEYNRQFDALE